LLATLNQDSGLLTSKMGDIANEFKSNWSAMSGADLSSWTRGDFNKMFEQLFPTKTFTNKDAQETYEQSKKMFNQLTDDWFKYAETINGISDNILSTQNDMIATMQSRYETYFGLIDSDLESVDEGIKDIKYSMDMLKDAEDFNERERLAQELISKTTTYRDTIQSAINKLITHRSTLRSGTAEWMIVNNQIKQYEDALQDANMELRNTAELVAQIKQQQFDLASGLQDKIVDALRTQYSRAKEDELEAVRRRNDVEIERQEAELDRLKRELEELQDQTQDKKDLLAKEKRELELWKKDDSAYAKSKVIELQASIEKHEKELAIDAKEEEI
jgi:chromosome segregation ATPase